MKKFLALILSAALAVSCLGCGNSGQGGAKESAAGEPVPLKIAFCTWAGYAPVFIGIEKGYFKELGYDVEAVIMEDESTYGAAFVSGSIQALGQVMDRDIIQYDAGAPEQYVCTMDTSTGGDGLIATADIQTVDDLKGKTIALDKSATAYFFFLQVLADYTVKEDEITIVEMGNDAAGEAFIAGQVDAAVTWEPALSNCSQREGGHILVSSADYPKAIIDVLTVSSTFLKDHPDAADALNTGWNKSVAYLNENFEEGCDIMAKGLDLTKEDVMDECSGITFYDEAMNKEFNNPANKGNIKEITQMAADFWVEKGYMKSNDVEGFFAYINK